MCPYLFYFYFSDACLKPGISRQHYYDIKTAIEEIQTDLDEFMNWYNTERTNQGRYCQGRTPMETFLAGIDLYRQFVYDEEVMKEAA